MIRTRRTICTRVQRSWRTKARGTGTATRMSIDSTALHQHSYSPSPQPNGIRSISNCTGYIIPTMARLLASYVRETQHVPLVIHPTGYITNLGGTSGAAPFVAGSAAIRLQAYPYLTPSDIDYRSKASSWPGVATGTLPGEPNLFVSPCYCGCNSAQKAKGASHFLAALFSCFRQVNGPRRF
jgi:subtilisin family serine protease